MFYIRKVATLSPSMCSNRQTNTVLYTFLSIFGEFSSLGGLWGALLGVKGGLREALGDARATQGGARGQFGAPSLELRRTTPPHGPPFGEPKIM